MTRILTILIGSGLAFADIVTLPNGTKHDNVWARRSERLVSIADPDTGKAWTVPNDGVSIETTSDHAQLYEAWLAKQSPSSPKTTTTETQSPDDAAIEPQLEKPNKKTKPIVIKYSGDAIPNPEVQAWAAGKAERNRAHAERVRAERAEAQAEAERQTAIAAEAAKEEAYSDALRMQQLQHNALHNDQIAIDNTSAQIGLQLQKERYIRTHQPPPQPITVIVE